MDENHLFQALCVEEGADGKVRRSIAQRNTADLPPGEVVVRVRYSSLNYKDALSASGNRGVTRRYPHTPGIDAAGEVVESGSAAFQTGDKVISVAMGDLGVNTPGGYGQFIRVPASWLLPLPGGLSLFESMAYGTAGFTAALCVERLVTHGTPPGGEVLVTGATGGVGMVAIMLLKQAGFQAVAATGKPQMGEILARLGASRIVPRGEMNDTSGKPLLHQRWAGVVDTVGGNFLSTAIRSTRQGGMVTACGNAASPELPVTVYPFILRGVTLAGIDATLPTNEERARIWKKLGAEWKLPLLDEITREVTLAGLDAEIEQTLKGGRSGRVVVGLG